MMGLSYRWKVEQTNLLTFLCPPWMWFQSLPLQLSQIIPWDPYFLSMPPTPIFFVSSQWHWFDGYSFPFSKAWCSPQCGGYLCNSGRVQSGPWRDRKEIRLLYWYVSSERRDVRWAATWCTGGHWHIPLVEGLAGLMHSEPKMSQGRNISTQDGGRPLAPLPHLSAFLRFNFRYSHSRRLKRLCDLILAKGIPTEQCLVIEVSWKETTEEKAKNERQNEADASRKNTQFLHHMTGY